MQNDDKNMVLLTVAWVAAIVATLGSLYFSEIRHFVPCTLCWFQRIFMYPMAVLLGVAMYYRDLRIARYTFILSVIGGSISVYHILLQNFPSIFHDACSVGVPCSGKYINWFGFVSIPVLALTAFVIIATVSVLIMKDLRNINS